MANYQNLLNSIAAVIRTNGNQEITGAVLQSTLQSMVSVMGANATYGGVAHPTDNPGTPDGPVVYVASEMGIYTNFGAISINADELAILLWNPTTGTWSKESLAYIADKSEMEDLIQQGIEDINDAKDDAIEEIEQIVQSVDVTYETISGENVQLKNGGGDLLMPKTKGELVSVDNETYKFSKSKWAIANKASHITSSVGFEVGKKYRIRLEVDNSSAGISLYVGSTATTTTTNVLIGSVITGATFFDIIYTPTSNTNYQYPYTWNNGTATNGTLYIWELGETDVESVLDGLSEDTSQVYYLAHLTFQDTNYLINYNRPSNWTTASGHSGYFIPVLPNTRYKITANNYSAAMIGILSSSSTSGSVQYAKGYNSFISISIGTSIYITTPSDANYIWAYHIHATAGDKTPIIDVQTAINDVTNGLNDRLVKLEHSAYGNFIDLMNFGCAGDGETDDTEKIQCAIDYLCKNGGGVIYGGKNAYKITQLVIPDLRPLQIDNGTIITLEFRGESYPATRMGTVPGALTTLTDTMRGTTMMLKSNLSNGEAIIKYNATAFSQSVIAFRNMQIRAYDNPNCSAIDAKWMGKIIMENVTIDTGIYNVSATEPTYESHGVILPKVNNNAMTLLDNVLVSGFKYGVTMGENADIRALFVMSCVRAIHFPSDFGHHSAEIGRAEVYRCTYPVYVDGTSYFHIANLNMEHPGEGQYTTANQWQCVVNELYDPNSLGYGFIRWNNVLGGTGNVQQFIKNGGNNVVTKWIGE